jgi:thymidylate synthase
MLDITGRNVNEIYPEALWKMRLFGQVDSSRNGMVMRIPGPVVTTYKKPKERMLLDPVRDANPFFHIFEGVWMLAGRNDVGWISAFNHNIVQFSDDGIKFNGAYGHRWRNHFGYDQLNWIISHLRADDHSRRAVLQMFDPTTDSGWVAGGSKDIPCNTSVYFDVIHGKFDKKYLNMSVTNRSNDMIWGCYGANVVHMSMLQEYLADCLGIEVGTYTQFSNNFHIYEKHFDLLNTIEAPYDYEPEVPKSHVSIVRFGNETMDTGELIEWIAHPDAGTYSNPFVVDVLTPMLRSYRYYKGGDKESAINACKGIEDLEVRMACVQWLQRRKFK